MHLASHESGTEVQKLSKNKVKKVSSVDQEVEEFGGKDHLSAETRQYIKRFTKKSSMAAQRQYVEISQSQEADSFEECKAI